MLIMIDTNIIYSAYLFPKPPVQHLLSVILKTGSSTIPLYVLEEFVDVVSRKFPDQLSDSSSFVDNLVEVILDHPGPIEINLSDIIRDPKDRPILHSAVYYGVDLLISGDKHFRGIEIEGLEILSPTEFVAKYGGGAAPAPTPPQAPATPPHSAS